MTQLSPPTSGLRRSALRLRVAAAFSLAISAVGTCRGFLTRCPPAIQGRCPPITFAPVAATTATGRPTNGAPLPMSAVEEGSAEASNSPSSSSPRRRRVRRSKRVAVAMVPPPECADVWEALTSVRRELRDPGFHRWPPHANLLYPFLALKDMGNGSDDGGGEEADMFEERMLAALERAAVQCEPFEVSLSCLGAFGGSDRAVLWLYPKSYRRDPADSSDCIADYFGDDSARRFLQADPTEPLIRLHSLLEEQFPMLIDPRERRGGNFHPHVTLGNFPSMADAKEAMSKVEPMWKVVTFPVKEFYVMRRVGENDQFEIAATVPLGSAAATKEQSGRRGRIRVHSPPLRFEGMPPAEEWWVKEERAKFERWTAERKARVAKRRAAASTSVATAQEVVVPEIPEEEEEEGEEYGDQGGEGMDSHEIFRRTRMRHRRRIQTRRRR